MGLEIRQNTLAVQGATLQELVHAADASLLAVANDSELADILVRGDADAAFLSPEELARYRALVRVYWRDFENAFLQHRSGLLSDEGWEVYIALICDNRQRFASTWYLHEPYLTSTFLRFVEEDC